MDADDYVNRINIAFSDGQVAALRGLREILFGRMEAWKREPPSTLLLSAASIRADELAVVLQFVDAMVNNAVLQPNQRLSRKTTVPTHETQRGGREQMSAPEFTSAYSCESCPCLNSDYEQGGSCNMGFDCDLRWTSEKKLIYCSPDCGLICVVAHNKKTIVRSELTAVTNTHPERWKDKP